MNRHLSKQLRPLMGVAVILSLYLGSAKVAAQPGQPFAGMDPQQIQQQIRQRAMEFFRDKLEVTKEEEWTVIETRLGKVVQLKAQTLIGGMLGGGGSPFGGGRGGLLFGRLAGGNAGACGNRHHQSKDKGQPGQLHASPGTTRRSNRRGSILCIPGAASSARAHGNFRPA